MTTPNEPSLAPCPARPNLVLRVGIAGSQSLTSATGEAVGSALTRIYRVLARQLVDLKPGVPIAEREHNHIASFYSHNCPRLRVITGLCQGVDELAAQALEQLMVSPESCATDRDVCGIEKELAAVLPFGIEAYRESRPEWYRDMFDRRLEQCSYVIALDGIYDKPPEPNHLADERRRRGYRNQSAMLLRQCDILVAVANPDDPARPGGTLETVQAAVDFAIPLVFIHTGTGRLYLIEPESDFYSVLSREPLSETAIDEQLQRWVCQITADPKLDHPQSEKHDGAKHDGAKHGNHLGHESWLAEYFEDATVPPLDERGERRSTWSEKYIWEKVARWFKPRRKTSGGAPPKVSRPSPYDRWRQRASWLNAHYSGRYRGVAILNYFLAVCAVILAAMGLIILGSIKVAPAEKSPHTHGAVEKHAHSDAPAKSSESGSHSEAGRDDHEELFVVHLALLVIGVIKLGIVGYIGYNTHVANHSQWNDRAIDYRYLAERMRALRFLPQVGSFQPPAVETPLYAYRALRQNAVDWLFDAITRSVSPQQFADMQTLTLPSHGGSRPRHYRLLELQPLAAAREIRRDWLEEQIRYHNSNAKTFSGMAGRLNWLATACSYLVIIIVAVDIFLVLAELFGCLHGTEVIEKLFTAFTAVLPVVVASANGLGLQLECRRIAERSAQMHTRLAGHSSEQASDRNQPEGHGGRLQEFDQLIQTIETAQNSSSTNLGSWSFETLRLTEAVAQDFAEESAEWSVLYSKELPELG